MARMRILGGLYVFNEEYIIGMAQITRLSLDTFKAVANLATDVDWMSKRIKALRYANGQESMEVWCHHYPNTCEPGCNRVRKYSIRAATSGGARGATADLLYVDELREIGSEQWAAASPVTRARKGSQTWVSSNAGDHTSTVLNTLRINALQTSNPRIGWYEWSADPNLSIDDPLAWQQANPALGHTVEVEKLQDAIANDSVDVVRTELLCQWVTSLEAVFPMDRWDASKDETLAVTEGLPTWIGIDLSFNRDSAYMVTLQQLDDEKFAVFVTRWLNPQDTDLAGHIASWSRKYRARVVAYDPNTAGHLAPVLLKSGVRAQPVPWASSQFGTFCDYTLQAMWKHQLLHPGQDEMREHLIACSRRPSSDGGWKIARKSTTMPIHAAMALVLAFGHASEPEATAGIMVV